MSNSDIATWKAKIKAHLMRKPKAELQRYAKRRGTRDSGTKEDIIDGILGATEVKGSWEKYEEFYLKAMDKCNLSNHFMAQVLGRSVGSISSKLGVMRNRQKREKQKSPDSDDAPGGQLAEEKEESLSNQFSGMNIKGKNQDSNTEDMTFEGSAFLLSGNLSMTHDKLRHIIESHGGKVYINTDDLNKQSIDFVIHKKSRAENNKTKLAKELKVPIIKEAYIHDSISSDDILDANLYRIDDVNDGDQEDEQEKKNKEEPSENTEEEVKEEMAELMVLEKLSEEWCKSNEINVKNLGIYLKKVVDGYKASIDQNTHREDSRFGTAARKFCEAFCDYLLDGTNDGKLYHQINQLSERWNNFPANELHVVRLTTNELVHRVPFNKDAGQRSMSDDEYHGLIKYIHCIALWLNDYLKLGKKQSYFYFN